jgi:hypothetical protein
MFALSALVHWQRYDPVLRRNSIRTSAQVTSYPEILSHMITQTISLSPSKSSPIHHHSNCLSNSVLLQPTHLKPCCRVKKKIHYPFTTYKLARNFRMAEAVRKLVKNGGGWETKISTELPLNSSFVFPKTPPTPHTSDTHSTLPLPLYFKQCLLPLPLYFKQSNIAIVGSNPTEAWMFVCVLCAFFLFVHSLKWDGQPT